MSAAHAATSLLLDLGRERVAAGQGDARVAELPLWGVEAPVSRFSTGWRQGLVWGRVDG